jgi:hypothetical protein
VVHRGAMRNMYSFVRKPEVKKQLRSFRHRYEDNIAIYPKVIYWWV